MGHSSVGLSGVDAVYHAGSLTIRGDSSVALPSDSAKYLTGTFTVVGNTSISIEGQKFTAHTGDIDFPFPYNIWCLEETGTKTWAGVSTPSNTWTTVGSDTDVWVTLSYKPSPVPTTCS